MRVGTTMRERMQAKLMVWLERFFIAMSRTTPIDPWHPFYLGPGWGYWDDEAITESPMETQ